MNSRNRIKRQKSATLAKSKKSFNINTLINNTNYHKVKDHCHYVGKCKGTAHSILNLKYSIPEKILVAFHSELNYDYHIIIRGLEK